MKGWTIKNWIVFSWIVIVLLLSIAKAYFFTKEPPAIKSWVGVKDLKENHQLVTSDITLCNQKVTDKPEYPLDSLVGRHLVTSIKAGNAIKPNDLSELPHLPSNIEKDYLVWLLPLRKEEYFLNSLVHQGGLVQLCSTEKVDKNMVTHCSATIKLLAIHQSRGNKGNDYWILSFASSSANEVGRFSAAKNRQILIKPL